MNHSFCPATPCKPGNISSYAKSGKRFTIPTGAVCKSHDICFVYVAGAGWWIQWSCEWRSSFSKGLKKFHISWKVCKKFSYWVQISDGSKSHYNQIFLFTFKGTHKGPQRDCVDRQMLKMTCFVVKVKSLFSNRPSVLSDCLPFVSKVQLMRIILPMKGAEELLQETTSVKCCTWSTEQDHKYSFLLNVFWCTRFGFIFTLLLPPAPSNWCFLEPPADLRPQAARAGASPRWGKLCHSQGFAQAFTGSQRRWAQDAGGGGSSDTSWCCGESQAQAPRALKSCDNITARSKCTCAIWKHNLRHDLKVAPGVKEKSSVMSHTVWSTEKIPAVLRVAAFWGLAGSWYIYFKGLFSFILA